MEANAGAVRLVEPYVEAAIAAAIANAITADDGAIKLAIGEAVDAAIATHAAKTTGVHGLT